MRTIGLNDSTLPIKVREPIPEANKKIVPVTGSSTAKPGKGVSEVRLKIEKKINAKPRSPRTVLT